MNCMITQQITIRAEVSPRTHEALSAIPAGRIRSALIQKILEDHFSMSVPPAGNAPSVRTSAPSAPAPPSPHTLNLALEDSEFHQTFADFFHEK
jgi:hypothetical protein